MNRKIFLFVTILCLSMAESFAQHPGRVIDPRCEIRDTNYDGYLFNKPIRYGTGICAEVIMVDAGESHSLFAGCRYFTDTTRKIYGIACTMWFYGDDDDTRYAETDSLWSMIIQKDGNNYISIDSVRYRFYGRPCIFQSGNARSQYMATVFFKTLGTPNLCYALTEFYFDNPVTIKDTFYVGLKSYKSSNTPHEWNRQRYCSAVGLTTYDSTTHRYLADKYELLILKDMVHDTLNEEYYRATTINPNLTFFPIIKPYEEDSVFCDTVPDFHIESMRMGYPTFAWDTDWFREEDLFEIQFAPYRSEEWRTVSTTDSSIEVYSVFDPDIYYQARVRARRHHLCPIHDTVMWGPWCRPILFYTGPTAPDTTNSIIPVVAETHAPFFTLTPNPTNGKVVVEVKSEKLKDKSGEATITLCDATGREVMKQKASTLNSQPKVGDRQWSQLSTLNLESFPAGTYFVTVTIGSQSGTRKLVVK